MPIHTILPDTENLDLICILAEARRITLTVRTATNNARCPLCRKSSEKVHSRYVHDVCFESRNEPCHLSRAFAMHPQFCPRYEATKSAYISPFAIVPE